jgi:hypothetical protein
VSTGIALVIETVAGLSGLLTGLVGPGLIRSGLTASVSPSRGAAPEKNELDRFEFGVHHQYAPGESCPHCLAADPETEQPASRESNAASKPGPIESSNLTEDEQQQVEELKQLDREVRSHEQAHKSAAGGHGGSIHLEYQTGPDGKRYAVGGEVPIDVSPVPGNPQATVTKMQQIRQAALAPASPSSQDRAVATEASRLAAEARAELRGRSKTPEAETDGQTVEEASIHGEIRNDPGPFTAGEPAVTQGELLDLFA